MSEDRCLYVTVRDDLGTILWNYQCDMVMCAKGEEGDKLSGVLRIYRTGKRVYDTEWDWRVFGDICKKGDDYYRYADVGPMTPTVTTSQGDGAKVAGRKRMDYYVDVRRISDNLLMWRKSCADFRINGEGDSEALSLLGTGDGPRVVRDDIDEGPTPSINITFEEEDGSPCDTGECDCYMGPIYSVFVGDIEFEETRSPDAAEAWEVFLPILERNPGFADFGITLREVE